MSRKDRHQQLLGVSMPGSFYFYAVLGIIGAFGFVWFLKYLYQNESNPLTLCAGIFFPAIVGLIITEETFVLHLAATITMTVLYGLLTLVNLIKMMLQPTLKEVNRACMPKGEGEIWMLDILQTIFFALIFIAALAQSFLLKAPPM